VGGRVLPGQRKETVLVFESYENGELVERIEEHSLVGITSREAVLEMLRKTGFEVRREWRSYDHRPYRPGDSLLIAEVVKVSWLDSIECKDTVICK
jgi:hypothetical protein